jgi:hypothetical protein
MTNARAGRALAAAAALMVAAASTSGCTKTAVGGLAHDLEPGLGANFSVTNHTNHALQVQARFSGRADATKSFDSLLLDYSMHLDPGATVWLPDVNLAANDCVGLALVAHSGKRVVARHPSPLCVNAKAVGGWTITTP